MLAFAFLAKKEHKKLPPLWDESRSHVLPPKFPVLFAKHRLCRSFDRPLTLDHASALRQRLYTRLYARKRFLRDHIPSSSQTGSQLIRLSALGVCLYLSLHWKSLYEKYTEMLPSLSSRQQYNYDLVIRSCRS